MRDSTVDEIGTGLFSPAIAWAKRHPLLSTGLLVGIITAALCTISIFTVPGLLPLFLTLAARITSIGAILLTVAAVTALSGLVGFIAAKIFIFYAAAPAPILHTTADSTELPPHGDGTLTHPTAAKAEDDLAVGPIECSIPDSPPIDVFKFVPHEFPDGVTRQVVSLDGENPLILRWQYGVETDSFFMPQECLVNGKIPMREYYFANSAEKVDPEWLIEDRALPILKPRIPKSIAVKIMATLNLLTSKAESMEVKDSFEAWEKFSEFPELRNLLILSDETSELPQHSNYIRRNTLELWAAQENCTLCRYINEGRESEVKNEKYCMFNFVHRLAEGLLLNFEDQNGLSGNRSECPWEGGSIQGRGPLLDIRINNDLVYLQRKLWRIINRGPAKVTFGPFYPA
jgi:hypothetical protein